MVRNPTNGNLEMVSGTNPAIGALLGNFTGERHQQILTPSTGRKLTFEESRALPGAQIDFNALEAQAEQYTQDGMSRFVNGQR